MAKISLLSIFFALLQVSNVVLIASPKVEAGCNRGNCNPPDCCKGGCCGDGSSAPVLGGHESLGDPVEPAGHDGVKSADAKANTFCECPMPMYFTMGCRTIILFKEWFTRDCVDYVVSLVILFFVSIFAVCLKHVREWCRKYLLKKEGLWVIVCSHFGITALAFCTYTLDFLLMLIVMTFNTGIFITVCAGYAIGYTLCTFTLANCSQRPELLGEHHMECC